MYSSPRNVMLGPNTPEPCEQHDALSSALIKFMKRRMHLPSQENLLLHYKLAFITMVQIFAGRQSPSSTNQASLACNINRCDIAEHRSAVSRSPIMARICALSIFPELVKPFKHAPRRQAIAKVASTEVIPDVASDAELTMELEAAVKAVRLASKLCQAVQAQLKSAEKVEKDDSSPVTVADYGAQALVAWSLQRSLPHLPFSMVAEEDAIELRQPEGAAMLHRITNLVNTTLAEETGTSPLTEDQVADLIDQGNSEGGPTGHHWVLDPIDGTRGFVGMRQYAVCLGLLIDGQVMIGVLGCPNLPDWAITDVDCDETGRCKPKYGKKLGCVFAAQKGKGAFSGPLFDAAGLPDTPIYCNDSLAPEEVRYMESFEARHSNHNLSFAIAEEVGIELPSLRLDSQAKYGALSRGDASIFMRFPPATYREKIWDHAAGAIIVEEAGACITDAVGNPLDFSQGRFFPNLNGGIVAATPSMHRSIMAALRKIREQ